MLPQTHTIEVFKTNISSDAEAAKLKSLLLQHFPNCRINFDLDDCDKILRIAGKPDSNKVKELALSMAVNIEELPD